MKLTGKIIILLIVLLYSAVWADRVALVIGNGAYSGSPLKNPVNDAHDMAAALRSLDFEVIEKTNLNRKDMVNAATQLENKLSSDDVALFYYSGHGIQVDGINYLIPVNADINLENDVEFEAVKINRIMSKLSRAKMNIIILDACRDNPFKGVRSASKGLAQITTNNDGTFIAYSTSPGKVAADGSGRNSPYTKHLIEQMQTDLKIEDTFKEVRISVVKETNNKQRPWESTSLVEDFYFCMSCAPKTTEPEIIELPVMILVPKSGEDYISETGINMVFVAGGTFSMGSNDGEDEEKPVHSVTVRDFYIGKYEVTQELYEKVMGKNPAKSRGVGDKYPVYYVSWYDAVEFCNKLSDREGLDRCYSGSGANTKCDFKANGYRLPTEAEWEFAARGGNKSEGYKYSGSNDISSVAEYEGNNDKSTKPVGGKKANELDIYDMSGNVWEWCWDWKGAYSSSAQTNPKGPTSGSSRVNRGGSWYISASYCRVAFRDDYGPGYSYIHLGFRLACSSK
jgi:formylglycine-generating enzyme required for sulfatase activity